jgi:hypothetical protein
MPDLAGNWNAGPRDARTRLVAATQFKALAACGRPFDRTKERRAPGLHGTCKCRPAPLVSAPATRRPPRTALAANRPARQRGSRPKPGQPGPDARP